MSMMPTSGVSKKQAYGVFFLTNIQGLCIGKDTKNGHATFILPVLSPFKIGSVLLANLSCTSEAFPKMGRWEDELTLQKHLSLPLSTFLSTYGTWI